MPPVSKKQMRFMGAELARKRAGEGIETGMSEAQLAEFATKPKGKKLPEKKKKSKTKKPTTPKAKMPKMPKMPKGLYQK